VIHQHTLHNPNVTLQSDLAGEYPLYLCWPKDKLTLIYSQSITELLDDPRVPKPLAISSEGISFLLQSGVVPPPKTAYVGIYILGIGDIADVTSVNGKVEISFTHVFPFLNANRLSPDAMQPDEDRILQMLAEATISRIDPSRPSFLFHSAGKDSNSIALALAEAGWQDKVTLITHKSKGAADESEISVKIAKQLSFKHQVLHEVDQLHAPHHLAIEDYFVNAPFPCADNVTLAYPLYSVQIPELRGANVIDGMGNDVYIGHIPGAFEFKNQKRSSVLKHGRFITKHAISESLLHVSGRSRSEWTGASGFSFSDVNSMLKDATDVANFWWKLDSNEDYLDFRASIRGTIIDQEIFIRKVRNFSDSVECNLVLPFTNPEVAAYFAKMSETYLFDRDTLKNKLILRKILKDRIGLDSDALGKMGFSYDSRSIVLQNWEIITEEIYACTLWSKSGLKEVVKRMRARMDGKGWGSGAAGRLLYRLYLVSSWHNKSHWLV